MPDILKLNIICERRFNAVKWHLVGKPSSSPVLCKR